jgi:hypothetical protein
MAWDQDRTNPAAQRKISRITLRMADQKDEQTTLRLTMTPAIVWRFL